MATHNESFNRKVIVGKASTGREASGTAAGDPSLDFVERRRFPRPLPVPEVIEKNSDSVWAEFESVVPFNREKSFTPALTPKSPDKANPLWLDTTIDNGWADTNFDEDL